jgi:hypothetical protein
MAQAIAGNASPHLVELARWIDATIALADAKDQVF